MASSISKGTLNLRFMQNAQPKEKDIKAEVTAATIRDESEWEVSKDVRDAWGIGSEPARSSMVAHEASYLPFVFSRSDDASGSSPRRPG
ncbi:hypothetical protein BC834DRAFT_834847 [Gloeopeniophorella convolvens]|nr:hypothetical protein BC834DRAFT_834847 [Gloeopeniophorella convolvens]